MKKYKDSLETIKELIQDVKNIFIHKFSYVVVDGTDYITLSYFLGLKNVNLYANYNLIIIALKGISSRFFNAIMPSVGDLLVDSSKEKVNNIFMKMFLLANFISIFFILGIYNFIGDFITIWLDSKFILPKVTLVLFLINFYINTTMSIFVIFKNSKGIFKDDIKFVYAQAFFNLLFSILLVQKYWINGILLGTLIGNLVGLVYPKIKIVYKKILNQSPLILLKYFSGILVIFMLTAIINKYIYIFTTVITNDTNLFIIFIRILIYSVFSLCVQVIFFLFFKEFKDLINILICNNLRRLRDK